MLLGKKGRILIRRVNLYLFRHILLAFLFSGIAVSFVVLFTQSFRMLAFVLDNAGSASAFFRLMGLMIPAFLPLIIPISLGIAVLFVYHKCVVDSEIVIMRAAGLSPFRLAAPVLAAAAAVMVLQLGLTLWLTPAANRALAALQNQVRDNYSALMIRPGTFNDLAEGLTFYARKRSGGGGLVDILVHDVRTPERPVTIMAEHGLFSVESGHPQVTVFKGHRQELDTATGRLQQLDFDRYVLDLRLLKNDGAARAPDPREMTLRNLFAARQEQGRNAKLRAKISAEIHQRLASPFLSLSFAMIGVCVILFGDFNRRGMARRVLAAAAAIVAVQAAAIGLVAQVSKEPWAALFLYLVVLAPAPVCIALLRRERPWSRTGLVLKTGVA